MDLNTNTHTPKIGDIKQFQRSSDICICMISNTVVLCRFVCFVDISRNMFSFVGAYRVAVFKNKQIFTMEYEKKYLFSTYYE